MDDLCLKSAGNFLLSLFDDRMDYHDTLAYRNR